MNKQTNEELNETIYSEVLENGLKVYILNKPGFKNTTVYYGIPYGSLHINQVDQNGKNYHFNPGIAHFIEHKLFENNKGLDVMERFSQLSCNVNAFTSHHETVYYFSTSLSTIDQALNLLLDFVQELNITKSSVEKEKGIIIQELSMYQQMPEQRLMYETYRALFSLHPLKFDIGGDEASVKSITKEELEECYTLNYHPSQASIIIVSALDPQTLVDMIVENQKHKQFLKRLEIKPIQANEPVTVNESYYEFKMDIQASKLTYTYKIALPALNSQKRLEEEWKVKLFLELLFSSINPQYEEWIKSGIIHDYFGYDLDFAEDYAFVIFYGETEDKDSFIHLIEISLNQDIDPLLIYLKGLKRRYLSYAYRILDDQDDYALSYLHSIFEQSDFDASIKIIKAIEAKDIKEARNYFDQKMISLVYMRGNKLDS